MNDEAQALGALNTFLRDEIVRLTTEGFANAEKADTPLLGMIEKNNLFIELRTLRQINGKVLELIKDHAQRRY